MNGPVSLVPALVRATFLVNAVYTESAREHGITQPQGQLLCVLMAQPYGMGELSTVLALAKSSLSGLVDRTERNGLVRREPDPHDTRAVRVALTPEGSRLAAAFYAETCARIEALTTGLSPADGATLTGLLGRIVRDNKVPMVFMQPEDIAVRGTN